MSENNGYRVVPNLLPLGANQTDPLDVALNELLDTWAEATEIEDFKDRNATLDTAINEAKAAINAEIAKAVTRARQDLLLRLKQAAPIDWLDAQAWIDENLTRLDLPHE